MIPVGSVSPSPVATDGAVAASRAPVTPRPATPAPTTTPTPAVTAAPSPTLVPTGPSAKPTSSPAHPGTYKVKGGDTLSGIAAKFGTTVKILADLNGMKDPSKLHVGQIIKLP